jgi:gliding motility-associated lipoprotein GldD
MRLLIAIVLLCSLFACRPTTYTPKPRGYAQISFPEHEYRLFSDPSFPYSFEYPVYGRIVRDTLFFGQKPENPYWINIDFPTIGGVIYLSYKPVTPQQPLDKLLEDSHEMSFTAHSKRADYIDDNTRFSNNENRVYGILYNIGGNAASAYQFIATDSAKHFVRGALYFDVSPNADSLRLSNEFLKKDIERLLETLKWNN